MAVLNIPFEIGQPLWRVESGYGINMVTCPECQGDGFITFVLKDGTKHTLNCRGCGGPYDKELGSGKVRDAKWEFRPVRFIPRRVDIHGEEFSYSESGPNETCYRTVSADDLFTTKEECEQECERQRERCKNTEWRNRFVKARNNKDAAWSVHYWRKQIRDHENDIRIAWERLNVVEVYHATKSKASQSALQSVLALASKAASTDEDRKIIKHVKELAANRKPRNSNSNGGA